MNRIMGRLAVTGCLAALAWTWGCGGAAAPGENTPMKTVEMECRQLKVPQLRERAIAYRDLIRAKLQEEQGLDRRIADADPDMVPEDEIARMKSEKTQLMESRLTLMERYQAYFTAVRTGGGDVSDLRIEVSPPPEPPSS